MIGEPSPVIAWIMAQMLFFGGGWLLWKLVSIPRMRRDFRALPPERRRQIAGYSVFMVAITLLGCLPFVLIALESLRHGS